MSADYLCDTWQELLHRAVSLMGRGYLYYHNTVLPEKKRGKWTEIDGKLIAKYAADKSKWQRARQKNKGLANYMYLRWDHIGLILRTPGEIGTEINADDFFFDLRERPLDLRISELTTLTVYRRKDSKKKSGEKTTVRLHKTTYEGVKDMLFDAAKSRRRDRLTETFKELNYLPAYAGIIVQKRRLATYVTAQAKRHGLILNAADLPIFDRLVLPSKDREKNETPSQL